MLTTYSSGLLQAKAYRVLKEYLSKELAKHKLSMPQWAFLGLIYDQKSVKLSSIAGALDVEAPFATNLADQLIEKGLIKRNESTNDRRVKLISLTKKGEELVPLVENDVKNSMRKIYNSVTREEMSIYLKVLHAITLEYNI